MLTPEEVAKQRAEIEERKILRRKMRRKRIFTNILITIVGMLLLFGTVTYSYLTSQKRLRPSASGSQRLNVLFLGTDAALAKTNRTDTIILVSVDLSTEKVTLLSIPRDTRVYIKDLDRYDRINAVFAHGGPELTVKTVSDFLGVDIDYYVKTDFAGFSKIIDILGGIEIEITKEMYYVDTAQNLEIHLLPGLQRLDGEKALQYVRYRDDLGDVALVDPVYQQYGGRVERQRKFISAVIQQVLQPSTIWRIPQLINEVWKIVDTNMPWTEVLSYGMALSDFTPDNIETAVIPGTSGTINGASYWLVDEGRTQQIVRSMISGSNLPLRIQVLNGTGKSGLAGEVAEMIRSKGYDVLAVRNADHFNYPFTLIYVIDDAAKQQAQPLAEIFGKQIEVAPEKIDRPVDVTIIVGRDYFSGSSS